MDTLTNLKPVHAETPLAVLSIRLFGPFEVRLNGQPLRVRTPKDLRLLARILLAGRQPIARDQLAAVFWTKGRSGERIWKRDRLRLLSTSLACLRSALGSEMTRLHKPSPQTLLFITDGADVDVVEFEAALARGDCDSLVQAAHLYRRGELLANWDDPWVQEARAFVRERLLAALQQCAIRDDMIGMDSAEQCLRLALEIDPLRESAFRAQMEWMIQRRRFSEAAARFEEFRDLSRETGSNLSCETESCLLRLKDEAQRFEASPLAGILPHPISSFVPRDEEVRAISEMLVSSLPRGQFRGRLVTLTGTGGVGKSRLAIEAGRKVREHFRDRAWFVELAAVAGDDSLVRQVALTLGVTEEPGRELKESLIEFLRQKQLLLILDNCEHLLNACATLCHDILLACPGVTILATSREMLRITGELVWRVPSMTMPNPNILDSIDRAAGVEVSAVLRSEAVQLFIERASTPQRPFELSESNVVAVALICRRLDGIPLAIELAAARVGPLTVHDIASSLDDRFSLLAEGSRAAPGRHKTLRALVDWSYELLTDSEQTLFRRLSVFSGGWTAEAAKAVCAVAGSPGGDGLDSLVAKSIVTHDGRSHDGRYRLLETMRQYAFELLAEAGEETELRRQHLSCFLSLAEQADNGLQGKDQSQWFAVLDAEHDNMRAALSFALRDAETASDMGLRLSAAMGRYWWTRGFLGEARDWYALALSRSNPDEKSRAKANSLREASTIAWLQGDHAKALELCAGSVTMAKEIGDDISLAWSLDQLGLVKSALGKHIEALVHHRRSLAIFRCKGDSVGVAGVLHNIGAWASSRGDDAEARACYEESLCLRRANGNLQGIAGLLMSLGGVCYRQGEVREARALFKESLSLNQEIGDWWSIERALADLALSFATPVGSAVDRVGNGSAADAPQSLLTSSIAKAAVLWGAAERLREEVGASSTQASQLEHAEMAHCCREVFGPDDFDDMWKAGRAMSRNEAIEFALERSG